MLGCDEAPLSDEQCRVHAHRALPLHAGVRLELWRHASTCRFTAACAG